MSHVDEGELTAYADGAYAPADPVAQRIASHLAECANCRNRLAQAQALSMRASEVLAVAAPLDLHTPSFVDIARVSSTRRRRFPAIPLTWAATVVLALGIGWFGRASVTPVTRNVQAQAEVAAPTVSSAAPPVTVATEQAQTATPPQPQAETRIRVREFNAPPASQLSVDVASEEAIASPAPGAMAGSAVSAFPMIPDLEVVSVRSVGDSVHVQQKLPDGVVITVMSRMSGVTEGVARERRAESAMTDAPARKQLQPVSTPQAWVYGPLTKDSLRALSRKVR